MRVIITGGATGIGKSCVQSLFFSGMNIDLIYFNSYNEATELENDNVNIHRVDVTDEGEVQITECYWIGDSKFCRINNEDLRRVY